MIRRLAAVLLLLLAASSLHSQKLSATPSGTTAIANGTTLEVTALRDDALRVRAWRGNNKPEDASWAVLPEARTARVHVSATPDGFHTQALQVRIDPQLRLTVSDLQGHILQQDRTPIAWVRRPLHRRENTHVRRPLLRPRRQARPARPRRTELHHVGHRRLRLAGVHRPYL